MFSTKKNTTEMPLMNSIFKQLLYVKGMVVESVRIVDGPMRPEPVLEVRVQIGRAHV